ncbi:hypothetical protein P389DRAFT_198731 [Cystobasidium minutum MCA 4210]|uniref:uncharacterized protein n=1 Tax=Cystobasidium minutum MCA 4210 TaxID=1397322 RepID=UPI0034CE8C56|eukprot:jgi/Rhomi1/198731/gm1.6945_g
MLVDEQELGPEAAARLRASPSTKVGICKILDKKEQFQKAKERSTASKQKKQVNKREEKEFQFTWGVAVNDLQHKIKRAQQTLDKGGRTALVITSPKGSKPPAPEDKRMFTDMLKEMLGVSEGKATIWKPEEWRGGKTSIYLEGVRQTQPVSPER